MYSKEENNELSEEKLTDVNGGYIGKIFLENTKTGDVQEYELTGNSNIDSIIINSLHNSADARNGDLEKKKPWWRRK